jgi:hypothetical protein
MVSIARKQSLRNRLVTDTTGIIHPSRAALCATSELDIQTLRAAKKRCERQVRRGRVSIGVGLVVGAAALVGACSVSEPVNRLSLLIAAAIELAFVPCCTTLACNRLRQIIVLIEHDLDQGLVAERQGQIRKLFGIWPVLEDCTTRRLRPAAAGRAAVGGLRPGALVTYRFAPRSQLVLAIEPEESTTISPRRASRRMNDRNITGRKMSRHAGRAHQPLSFPFFCLVVFLSILISRYPPRPTPSSSPRW